MTESAKHKNKGNKSHNILENIFSVTNDKTHKVFNVFGLKLKFKCNKLIQRQKLQNLEKQFAKRQKMIDDLQNVTLKNNQIAALTEIAMLKTKYNWISRYRLLKVTLIPFLN
ncbi:MAG: hypothetical protein Q4D11_05020 [Rhodospirillales bacterium]|nr:hypothetical protein [Rhodospirillales bacterium]